MVYRRPTTDSDGHSSIDGKGIPFRTAVEATDGGFGVKDPNTNTFEILDAMPLGKQSTQLAVERGSAAAVVTTVNFATQDYVTATEVDPNDPNAIVDFDSDSLTSDLT